MIGIVVLLLIIFYFLDIYNDHVVFGGVVMMPYHAEVVMMPRLEYHKISHKMMFGERLTLDLFKYHHKRNYNVKLREELLPIA
jgi:hypothetical protein